MNNVFYTSFYSVSEEDFIFPESCEHESVECIVKYTGKGGDVVIPEKIGGAAVFAIMDGAFDGRDDINSITVPDCVKYIGDKAFDGCTGLTVLLLPKQFYDKFGVAGSKVIKPVVQTRQISSFTFGSPYRYNRIKGEITKYNGSESEVTVPSVIDEAKIYKIGEKAFFNCMSIVKLYISNGMNIIGSDAFCNCRNLTAVSIPETIKTIRANAFRSCTSLKLVLIPRSVKEIIASQLEEACIPPSTVRYY